MYAQLWVQDTNGKAQSIKVIFTQIRWKSTAIYTILVYLNQYFTLILIYY